MEFRSDNSTFEETDITRQIIELSPFRMVLQVSGYFTDENGLQQAYTVRDIYQKEEAFSLYPIITN